MLRVLVDRILGSKGNATCSDDDHDEQVKVAQVHDKVTEATNPETKMQLYTYEIKMSQM